MWWLALGGRAVRAEHTIALVAYVVVLGSRLTHSYLIVIIRSGEWAILVRLHREVASSGTRCSSYKPVVLVTLGGCHLLDSLVAYGSVEAYKKIMWGSGEALWGNCAHPVGIGKSNSSSSCPWATTLAVDSCDAFGRLGCGYRLAAKPRGVGWHNGD
jgi:hypothetical protein